jgi:hypothetical protein
MMRSVYMVDIIDRSQKSYVLDSCIGRRCYENPEYLDMLKLRFDLKSIKTVFTTVSVYEVDKSAEYGFNEMQSKLESSVGIKIKVKKITYEMNQLGIWLIDNNEGLHTPDDRILAYAMLTDSVLITCDKGLETAARNVGQDVINPDNVMIDFTKTTSDLVKLTRSKVSQIRQKMNRPVRIMKKPVTKIVWRTFV